MKEFLDAHPSVKGKLFQLQDEIHDLNEDGGVDPGENTVVLSGPIGTAVESLRAIDMAKKSILPKESHEV